MNAPGILVVEDDASLAAGLVRGLKGAGFAVDLETSGRDVVRRVLSGEHAVVVLDLNLPDVSGFSILEQLKERARTPIIVLTARTELAARLSSFERGAADYLSKPFFIEELLARIHVRLGRDAAGAAQCAQLGALAIDFSARTVSVAGSSVRLTRTEFDLLAYLCKRPGRAVARRHLADDVLPSLEEADLRTIDVHIARIRRKLGAAGKLIKSVWGIGYRLEVEVGE